MVIVDQLAFDAWPSPAVVVAQAGEVRVQKPHALGVCAVVVVGPTGTGQGEMFPVLYANAHYFKIKNRSSNKIDDATAKVSVIKPPKHGRVEPVMNDGDLRDPRYLPDVDFLGNDSFVLRVEGGGYAVQLRYFFHVTNDASVTVNPSRICKGDVWTISSSNRFQRTSDFGTASHDEAKPSLSSPQGCAATATFRSAGVLYGAACPLT